MKQEQFVIDKNTLETLFAIVTRSTVLIPGLTTGDYMGISQRLQNLPKFEHEEESKE